MIAWQDISISSIKEGIDELRAQAEKARQVAIDEANDFYYGGDRTKSYLVRHPAEEDDHWFARRKRFCHWGYTGAIGETLRDAIAARPIIREIVGASETVQSFFNRIYSGNRVLSLQRDWYQGQVVHGDGFARVSFSPALGRVVLHSPDVENVWIEKHAEDARVMKTYVEEINHPYRKDELAYWVWTDEAYILIDGTSEPITWEDGYGEVHSGWLDNPYGRIPAAHVRGKPMSNEIWGQSLLVDVIQLNRLVNNRASDLDRLFEYQAHSQAWVKGQLHTIETEAGPTRILGLDPGDGEYGYATPQARLIEGMESLKDLCSRMFDISGVPDIAVRGGCASSGYELEVRFRRMDEVVRDMKVEARPFEEDTAAIVVAVANAHASEIPKSVKLPEDPEFNIEFETQLFPKDEAREREEDRQDWLNNLMTTEDYLKRQRPDLTEKELPEYIAKLEEQRSRTSVFGGTPEAQPTGSLLL